MVSSNGSKMDKFTFMMDLLTNHNFSMARESSESRMESILVTFSTARSREEEYTVSRTERSMRESILTTKSMERES